MLTKRCRKILKVMNSEAPDIPAFGFSLEYISKLTGIPITDMPACALMLRRQGFAENINFPDTAKIKGLWLTEEGKFYVRYSLYRFLPFIISTGIAATALILSIISLVMQYNTPPTN